MLATPNKDDQELLSLGPEQVVTSLQELCTLPASLFQCFIVFPYKLDRFMGYVLSNEVPILDFWIYVEVQHLHFEVL